MEDHAIIALYNARDEAAIAESNEKYGAYCFAIAENILNSHPDCEECVNDTWLRAWNAIPPARPAGLRAFFGHITRNLALDRYRRLQSEKRGGGELPLALEELSGCVATPEDTEDAVELRAGAGGSPLGVFSPRSPNEIGIFSSAVIITPTIPLGSLRHSA